jgi:hypothetical protein
MINPTPSFIETHHNNTETFNNTQSSSNTHIFLLAPLYVLWVTYKYVISILVFRKKQHFEDERAYDINELSERNLFLRILLGDVVSKACVDGVHCPPLHNSATCTTCTATDVYCWACSDARGASDHHNSTRTRMKTHPDDVDKAKAEQRKVCQSAYDAIRRGVPYYGNWAGPKLESLITANEGLLDRIRELELDAENEENTTKGGSSSSSSSSNPVPVEKDFRAESQNYYWPLIQAYNKAKAKRRKEAGRGGIISRAGLGTNNTKLEALMTKWRLLHNLMYRCQNKHCTAVIQAFNQGQTHGFMWCHKKGLERERPEFQKWEKKQMTEANSIAETLFIANRCIFMCAKCHTEHDDVKGSFRDTRRFDAREGNGTKNDFMDTKVYIELYVRSMKLRDTTPVVGETYYTELMSEGYNADNPDPNSSEDELPADSDDEGDN